MVNYHYEGETFVIENYDKAKTFSSFLPGIAGLHGVPLWAFYVNRGQGICSFGLQDKNTPILEFFPANTSYQHVHNYGFRTFVKVEGEVYEPFAPHQQDEACTRYMYTEASEFKIREVNETRGIELTITYFGLPNEPFGALVRRVEIKNLRNEAREIEVLDGLANLLPYGSENGNYKEMSNLLRSWMDVENIENRIPFYKLRASTGDEAEISTIERGHFAYSFTEDQTLLPVIVDLDLVFGYDTTLSIPVNFTQQSISSLVSQPQVTANKVPCQFAALSVTLEANQVKCLDTVIGHVFDIERIQSRIETLATHAYMDQKQQEAKQIIQELTQTVETQSANSVFDAYAKQNYLDNLLRGGYPLTFGTEENLKVYHVYSRKHGDLERDYNFFSIAPEFYSQGNGNFRDVNQNRRNDVFFNPKTGLYNVKTFMNLAQLDGYNPLGVAGSTFSMGESIDISELVAKHFATDHEVIENILGHKFTPGAIVNTIENEGITLKTTEKELLDDILGQATQNIEANFGEGFWVDHWTYNMDLIENYLSIYPDQLETFMFEDQTYSFFESPVSVLPRQEKYVLNKEGKVRQYGSILEDEEKATTLSLSHSGPNWVKVDYGQGEIYHTNLVEKLISLALTKFTHLDPEGLGLEMEANKPGWNDAMNGLPGVFGSGVSEAIELTRVLNFLNRVFNQTTERDLSVLVPTLELLKNIEVALTAHLEGELTSFEYWNRIYTVKELYREGIRLGVSGACETISTKDVQALVLQMLEKLARGLQKAIEIGEGVVPTFFYFEATDFTINTDEAGQVIHTHYGLPSVTVHAFEPICLPYFLEAPARQLKASTSKALSKQMYEKLKTTDVYDEVLKMYKTSGSLNEMSLELGRIRAFTPGWLERESNFLHMTYKYLLGLLKSGLYDEFYEEIKTNFVCFLDPHMYGRSTLENSSFIATSVNPNPALHGQGFVARLSGSTAEFLSMYNVMMVGKKWFSYVDDVLTLTFNPLLPSWLFDEKDRLSFTFLGQTKVTYVNPNRVNTYDEAASITKIVVDGVTYEDCYLSGDVVARIRNQEVATIEVYFN